MNEWFVFRDGHKTYFGLGSRDLASRFLDHLNRNRAVNHFSMDKLEDFPALSTTDVETSPDRVDMEEELRRG